MRTIFIGDIVGRPGRQATVKLLPQLKKKYSPDLILANSENVSHGRGITEESIKELTKVGINFFTSGNHVFAQAAILPKLEDKKFPVIRPANFPPGNPGRGFQVIETAMMQSVLIINLMGRVFMRHNYDCPFRTLDRILDEHKTIPLGAIFVDIHAEATSEKIALAKYADGRVSAVLGTHTHVPTTDAQIFEKGTSFISDIGMVGVKDSIIGCTKEPIIRGFLTQMPFKYEIPDGPVTFNAVYIETNDSTKKTEKIEQIIEIVE
jgi:metallophosphoesterase (TIGR00282 family)